MYQQGRTPPSSSEGGWIFDTPAGASIASFTMQGPFLGTNGWQAAVMAAGQVPVENCPGATCPGCLQVPLPGTSPFQAMEPRASRLLRPTTQTDERQDASA